MQRTEDSRHPKFPGAQNFPISSYHTVEYLTGTGRLSWQIQELPSNLEVGYAVDNVPVSVRNCGNT